MRTMDKLEMKITRIKTFKFSVPTGPGWRDPGTGELTSSTNKAWLFLKIETDTELAGWGEGPIEWLVPPVENFLIQEANDYWFKSFARYVDHDWTIEEGTIKVTDRPGLGIDVKEEDIKTLPYQPMAYRQYRHRDGSWKDW